MTAPTHYDKSLEQSLEQWPSAVTPELGLHMQAHVLSGLRVRRLLSQRDFLIETERRLRKEISTDPIVNFVMSASRADPLVAPYVPAFSGPELAPELVKHQRPQTGMSNFRGRNSRIASKPITSPDGTAYSSVDALYMDRHQGGRSAK